MAQIDPQQVIETQRQDWSRIAPAWEKWDALIDRNMNFINYRLAGDARLRPGGQIQIADIVLGKPIKESSRENPQLWAECIVGAVLEEEYLELFRKAGFEDMQVITHLDYFSKSPEQDTREVAAKYGARTVVLKGIKPK